MSFYYCIFSVACLEEEKKKSKTVKKGQFLFEGFPNYMVENMAVSIEHLI